MLLLPTLTPDMKMMGLSVGTGSSLASCHYFSPWNRDLSRDDLLYTVHQQSPPWAAPGQQWDAGWADLQRRLNITQLSWKASKGLPLVTAAMQAAGVVPTGKGSPQRYTAEDFDATRSIMQQTSNRSQPSQLVRCCSSCPTHCIATFSAATACWSRPLQRGQHCRAAARRS